MSLNDIRVILMSGAVNSAAVKDKMGGWSDGRQTWAAGLSGRRWNSTVGVGLADKREVLFGGAM